MNEYVDVIFLTNNSNTYDLFNWLKERCTAVMIERQITIKDILTYSPKLIVSYNYSHIVTDDVIDYMSNRIINLHISYLPWNRGASPNFWSFIDDTPKGVTIHLMSKGLDRGDVLYQEEMFFDETKETMESTYNKLHEKIVSLFKLHWKDLYENSVLPHKQIEGGTYHSIKDFQQVKEIIDFSWNETIETIVKRYKDACNEKIVHTC